MPIKSRNIIFAIVAALSISISGCRDDVERALECAGDNRVEIEKVLDYFKDDPDPLKLCAAKYLIKNMPYHYHYRGEGVEYYDSAYMAMSRVPYQMRDSVFSRLLKDADMQHTEAVPDIVALNSDYLIEAINEACEAWEKTPWHDDYDDALFFEYVLPYRLMHERPSRWRLAVSREFPYLMENVVSAVRGQYHEAEDALLTGCKAVRFDNASQGEIVILENIGSSVSFQLPSPSAAKKQIKLRYSSASEKPEVRVVVNGHDTGIYRLDPTVSVQETRDSRCVIEVELQKGDNVLTIQQKNGVVGLDRITVSTLEFNDNVGVEDFSNSLYRIRNHKTGGYITFDTVALPKLKPARVCPVTDKGDSCSMVRLDFKGGYCWSMLSYKRDSTEVCLDVTGGSTEDGTAISQYRHKGGDNQKWVFIPTVGGLYRIMGKDSGLFLDVVDTPEGAAIIQAQPADSETQEWRLEKCGVNPAPNQRYPFGGPVSAAMKVFEVINRFEWMPFRGTVLPGITALVEGKTGNCLGESAFTVSLCRSMGIPAAIDFTPSYANRSEGHSWSVLINPDGKSTMFHKGFAPGDSVYYISHYIKPKVYRYQFGLNRVMAEDFKGEKEVPQLFRYQDFIDVTDQYCEVTDVTRHVPGDKEGRIVYICVFDNEDWIPVDYAKVKDGTAVFRSMARNAVYISAIYSEGRVQPFGNPFHIDKEGNVTDLVADHGRRQEMTVMRKYPFMGYHKYFNVRMDGGRFEGSNSPGFRNATVFHTHKGLTDGNWYDIDVRDTRKYRYVRYIGPEGSHCNINEIEFISHSGEKLRGRITGSEGIPGKEKDKVFDGDILTGFEGKSPDGHWVGMDFDRPERIGRIRYIPRNDGNCIEVGDLYKLLYWHDDRWALIDERVATSNRLDYKAVPSGALYLVKNLTKGSEERIFTYENGKQIWW